jgi:hypothetical protein
VEARGARVGERRGGLESGGTGRPSGELALGERCGRVARWKAGSAAPLLALRA